jgi:hypothetical protein
VKRTSAANKVTGANAGGPRSLTMRARWDARVAQFTVREHHMRIVGYSLLIIGFLWTAYVPLSVGPLLRAMDSAYRRELSGPGTQQSYSAKDVISARVYGADDFSRFTRLGGIGALVMLAGGVLLDRSGRRGSAAPKPPLLEPHDTNIP